jgi:hypothetical protein
MVSVGSTAAVIAIRNSKMTENISATHSATINHPRPRTAAQALGIKAPKLPAETPKKPLTEPTKNAKMQALGRRASAITAEERDERRTRVLDYLQQVRIATRRDIDRVAGYTPGTTHNRVLETLYKRRLVERIENIDSSQTLYTLTARGNVFASAPIALPPLTTSEWQNSTQQEHRLGVARFMSVLMSSTKITQAYWDNANELRAVLLDGDYILLGEPQINATYAERFGKKKYPTPDTLPLLYKKPTGKNNDTPLARSEVYENAWWYMIPPYLHAEKDEPIRVLTGENADTPLTPSPETIVMQRHPADAVIAPATMQNAEAVAIEIERYPKSAAAYETTMCRYGSALGRARFSAVIWACATHEIANAIERAAEKTSSSDMCTCFVYDTGRRNGSFLQGTEFRVNG